MGIEEISTNMADSLEVTYSIESTEKDSKVFFLRLSHRKSKLHSNPEEKFLAS